MGLILILFGLSIVLVSAEAAVLVLMWRESNAAEPPPLGRATVTGPPQFFIDTDTSVVAAGRDARVDRLLRQLEQHIRLEQAAAESYHLAPTADALHRHTDSPLVLH